MCANVFVIFCKIIQVFFVYIGFISNFAARKNIDSKIIDSHVKTRGAYNASGIEYFPDIIMQTDLTIYINS